VPPATEEDEDVKFAREAENADKHEMAKMLFSSEIKLNAERERDLNQNLTILWATIMGQCSPALQEEVKGHPDYIAKSSDFHSIWLLETLQKVTAGVNKTTNMYFSAFKATKKFYLTQQGGHENVDEYYNRFDNATDLVHLFNADIVDIDNLLVVERVNDANITKDTVLQKYMAVALVMNANKSKYESLWNKLENDLLVGQDSYPTTIGGATHLLTNWRGSNNNNNRNGQGDGSRSTSNDGGGAPPPVNFAQTQVPLPANRDFSNLAGYDPARPTCAPSRKHPHHISDHITCTKCQIKGHYATACPFTTNAAPQLFQLARPTVQLNQTQNDKLLAPHCIIVDSGSTFNCFNEASLLTNLKTCAPFNTFSNGGGMIYNQHGTIASFPSLTAYYNPNCLVNIISLDLLQAAYHTTFNSAVSNAFTVQFDEHNSIVFEGFGSGLYYYNLKETVTHYPLNLLNTVSENKSFFSRREIEGAEKAREQQGQIGWPSDQEYYKIIRDNRMRNSKVTLNDLRIAEYIYGGPAVNLLKGKTVYSPVNTSRPIERVPLPPHILKTHPTDSLDIDFMYCQGAPYLLMKTQVIKFQAIQSFNRIIRIIQHNNSRRITYKRCPTDIINGIEKVLGLIRTRGFTVCIINADNEFQKIENKVSAHLEICAAGQHIPRIERGI
jgi:hypothetical protein